MKSDIKEQILQMHDKGYTNAAIAQKLGLSESQARNTLQLAVGERAVSDKEDDGN